MSSGPSDRRVFVDTSAYYAAVDQRDASHAVSVATMRWVVAERYRLITTNFILAELHALLLNRINRQVALETLIQLRASQTVVRVSVRDETRAEEILAQYDDKDFSFTDATCFAVMERLGITQAFSLDQHFAQYGWALIRPPSQP